MNWELIKKGVTKEIESTIHTIDPAFDIDYCLNLYSKVLKYKITLSKTDNLEGLENAIHDTLNENFVQMQVNDTSIGIFCKNFEQFIKQIYYILEENGIVSQEHLLDNSKLKTLSPFLSVLNKIRPIYLDSKNNDVYEAEAAASENGAPKFKKNKDTNAKMFIRLYPDSLSFDKYLSVNDKELNEKYENNFLLFLIKAVILKNEQSHQVPERSRIDNVTNFNSTLIAELFLINFFKKELNNCIKKDNYKNRDLEEYLNSEINRLRKLSTKFVSLNLKELTNQTSKGRNGLIENLINENISRMRILGQGGSGKTTTLEYLFYKEALNWITNPAGEKIPVLISLANLSSKDTIIGSIALKMNVETEYVEELLETNEIKVYLDGLNEIVESTHFKKLKLQEIAGLIDDYPTLNILITDRYEFDSYQNNMFHIPTFIIQKIEKEQIQEFVEKYCDYSNDLSLHVLDILNSKTQIQELLLRPLVLTRAIEIIKIENELPEKEGEIIEKFIDILLKREKDEKRDPLLNVNTFKLLLSYAANEIWNEYKTNAPLHQFKFNKLLIEASNKFGVEKFNAGYITRIGYELEILSKNDEQIQFYHQSYIEFFCKHYLIYEFR